jgi:hypothetical protein
MTILYMLWHSYQPDPDVDRDEETFIGIFLLKRRRRPRSNGYAPSSGFEIIPMVLKFTRGASMPPAGIKVSFASGATRSLITKPACHPDNRSSGSIAKPLRDQLGFRDYPHSFEITWGRIDETYETEGFVTVQREQVPAK